MIYVIKKDNTKEEYNEEKVISSIKRAKIPDTLQHDVLNHIRKKVYDGITTDEIYHHIIEFLGKSSHPFSKSRYSLKEAIMRLGPTGYPFEDFVSKLLIHMGYQTQVRQILIGKCVTHEIDILAKFNNKAVMIEAKFHNRAGVKSEVHVALYTHARFEDIKEKYSLNEAWLVTNTKTTHDANAYALCSGMKVISWNFPQGEGLRELIERSMLHPVTMLTTLSQSQIMTLLNNHIVLCRQVYHEPSILSVLHLTNDEYDNVLAEVRVIGEGLDI